MVLHQQKDTNVLIEAMAEDNLSHTLTIVLGGRMVTLPKTQMYSRTSLS